MRQLMHSFTGKTVPQAVLEGIADGTISSICLFSFNNVGTPQGVRDLNMQLINAATENNLPPPLIGIDQEGGQLQAIGTGTTQLPGNMALGATRSEALAQQAGYVLARELLAMGINLNFAPSVDVNNNPQNPVIGIRAFGDDADLVGRLGAAMIYGMQNEGLLATVKHFPGHGDTGTDTHHTAPVVDFDLARVTDVELKPFREAIAAGVGVVMSSHIVYPAFDAEYPATVSRKIMHDLLRDEMGFTGLNITDAMDMYAVSRYGTEESVKMALAAGVDLVCLAHVPDHIGLNKTLRQYENPDAINRIMAARHNIPQNLPDIDVVNCTEHQQIAQNIADKSITIVRDNANQIPLKPASDETLAVITVRPADLTPADTSSQVKIRLADAMQKRHEKILALDIPHQASNNDIDGILQAVAHVEKVIIGTISADTYREQAALVQALQDAGKQVIVIALRTPYDIIAFPYIETYLCAYGIRDTTTEAIAKVLFGEIIATGILPCEIPGIQPTYNTVVS